jgi:predicted phosphodiesterase
LKIFVCSDIHGNIRALEAVLNVYRREYPCDFLFLGDCIGYGPQPDECLDTILELPHALYVMGNHEHALLNESERTHMSEFAAVVLNWTERLLAGRYEEIIADNFKMDIDRTSYYAVHSSPCFPGEWPYLYTLLDAEEAFLGKDFHIGFVGHTHIPAIFSFKRGEQIFMEGEPYPLDRDDRYIINPGSVGQPRDLNRDASCCVFDMQEGTITLYRCQYDVEAEMRDFIAAGLPQYLSDRLLKGS